jgi:hypothetical protein
MKSSQRIDTLPEKYQPLNIINNTKTKDKIKLGRKLSIVTGVVALEPIETEHEITHVFKANGDGIRVVNVHESCQLLNHEIANNYGGQIFKNKFVQKK